MGCEAQKDVGGQYKHGLCGSTAETGECSTREHQGTISCTFRGLNVITLMGWINLIFFSKMIIGHNWPLFFGDFLLHIFWHFDTWLHRAIFYLMGLKILLAPYVISCQNFSCGARRIFISIEQTKNSLFFVFLLPQKVYLTEDICFCVFFHIFHLLSFLTCLTLPFEINEFQQLRLCQFQWPNFLCVILVDIHNGTRCIDMKILFSPLDSLVPKGFSNLKCFFFFSEKNAGFNPFFGQNPSSFTCKSCSKCDLNSSVRGRVSEVLDTAESWVGWVHPQNIIVSSRYFMQIDQNIIIFIHVLYANRCFA